MKRLSFVGSSLDDLRAFPAAVRHAIGVELMRVQFGGVPTNFKPLKEAGSGAYEIRVRLDGAIGYRIGGKTVQIDWRFEMKKPTRRWKDDRITPSSGNVFVDLGFEEAEAHVMALRAHLMLRLSQELKAKGWTQAQAAKRLGVTQPRVSKLNKGAWQDFSLDMLLTLAGRAGLHAELRVA